MIDFTKEDSDYFQNYLHKSDYKLIKKLKELIPKVESKTIEGAALEGAKKQGAEDIIEELEKLSEVTREVTRENPNVDITQGIV